MNFSPLSKDEKIERDCLIKLKSIPTRVFTSAEWERLQHLSQRYAMYTGLPTESTKGIEFIARERRRQIEEEGYSTGRDSKYTGNQLAYAAICYILPDEARHLKFNEDGLKTLIQILWPWGSKWWKPTPEDRIKELSKAGALIAAEIDRLNNQPTKSDS